MFEVWAEWDVERVGQRRVRKEIERELKKKDDSNSLRESISARSSLSSSDRTAGILGSIGRKIGNTTFRGKKKPPTTSQCPKDSSKQKRASVLSQSAVVPSTASFNKLKAATDDKLSEHTMPTYGGHADHSIFSKATEITLPTSSLLFDESAFDPSCIARNSTKSPGPGIRVTQTSETTYDLKEDVNKDYGTEGPKLTISASSPAAPTPNSPDTDKSASHMIHEWYSSIQGESKSSNSLVRTPSRLGRQNKKKKVSSSPSSPLKLAASSPDAWKPPDDWQCGQEVGSAAPTPQKARRVAIEEPVAADPLSLDLAAMQREIAKMAIASPQIIIVRLNEEWGDSNDAAFYKELEMEKQRWMLSALHNMDRLIGATSTEKEKKALTRGQKILALFETQATASYIAALNPKVEIVHLAPSPLSHTLFPNVQPLFSIVNTTVPLAASSFTAVHSLTLPSLMPSQDIPPMLRNIHRCLAPEGVLYLTLIDPSPATKSIGPHMRQWLEENLLLNLESQFRCISPSRLLPVWLASAKLRGQGSTISRMKFPAICPLRPANGSSAAEKKEKGIGDELRATVGRKLWQEIWGKFVHGHSWWWEDQACVEECLQLGTYFEWSLVEAVKDST
ncbi:hypothetical protein B0T25DRAFT_494802 [Lasiosphaeria hispida]|uniref:Methyltransferase type 11 domain-containing protein n=1 Tax=Lasiosphaeria hispida TaxID=260671 RepID=A0AAJ0HQC2_9PEZI|nr:hypothetical protein B0T25DRAFT_494802 [Lasiosphaeria hispida]